MFENTTQQRYKKKKIPLNSIRQQVRWHLNRYMLESKINYTHRSGSKQKKETAREHTRFFFLLRHTNRNNRVARNQRESQKRDFNEYTKPKTTRPASQNPKSAKMNQIGVYLESILLLVSDRELCSSGWKVIKTLDSDGTNSVNNNNRRKKNSANFDSVHCIGN